MHSTGKAFKISFFFKGIPGQSNVETTRVRQETDALVLVGANAGYDNDVLLSALSKYIKMGQARHKNPYKLCLIGLLPGKRRRWLSQLVDKA